MNYYDLGGTFRSQEADCTLKKVVPLFPQLGISRVAHITGLDHVGISVSTCIRPEAKHLSVSQGKGFNQALADVSAIMEAVEAYHMENPPLSVLTGCYQQLKSRHPVISPDSFERGFFQSQLDGRVFDWVQATEWASQQGVLIPHILTSLDSTVPHPEYAFLSVSTNGVAAGNSFEEALCHALCEVIERDALFQWKQLDFERRKQQQLNINTIDDFNIELVEKIQAANLFIKVWEISSDIDVPTYHCALYDKNIMRGLNLFTGTGTHLSKAVALSRAITEAVQARLTVISGNRDDIFPSYYQAHQAMIFNVNVDEKGVQDYQKNKQPRFSHSFSDNVKQLSDLVYEKYSHLFIVEHTKIDIGIPVVQVIVPGMHFDGRRM